MSRVRVVLALFLGLLFLVGYASSANAAEKPDGTMTVSGTVLDPSTGTPASNASVRLVTSSNSSVNSSFGVAQRCYELYPNPNRTGVTDASGQFSIKVKAYSGSKGCKFDVVGTAALPSGTEVVGSAEVQGLIPGATVELTLQEPAAEPSAQPRAAVEQTPTETDAAGASTARDTPESGFPRWLDDAGPWLLRIGLLLAVVALIAFFLWLTVLVARAAQRKGRSYWAWFWIAFFFLIPAAIIVAIMAPRPEYQLVSAIQPAPTSNAEPVKRCPYCGEEILAVAKKCKHCGEFLPAD